MSGILEFVGPTHAVQLFGVKLVGLNAVNGRKALFTVSFIATIWLLSWTLGKWTLGKLAAVTLSRTSQKAGFWTKQGIHLISVAMMIIGISSVWFSDPARLATAFGLVTAGLAFALQRVITALAAYLVILRGKTFSIGDRIVMGGVRGDVIELGFIQTMIMEMGQPPAVQNTDPAVWVQARQYTGRVVTLTNDKIFDTPVYNYTREFRYIWDELSIPVTYTADVRKAEDVMLAGAQRVTVQIEDIGEEALAELERRYLIPRTQFDPKVFFRLTDNWVELTVRFVTREHGVRDLKDQMSREILREFTAAGIGVASSTYDIVGMPPISVKLENPDAAR